MMTMLKMILSVGVLFLVHSAPPVGGASTMSPQDARIQELRKQIKTLRAKSDVKGLQQLGVDIKAEWLAKKSPAYYSVILDLCVAMSSARTTEAGINETIRDLATAAIDAPEEKPAYVVAEILLLLQGDFDYATGALKGEEWVQERRTRAERWLKAWKSIHEQNAAMPKPTGVVYINLMPPPSKTEVSFAGQSPESIKDPVRRKQYEEALARNAKLADAYSKKRHLELSAEVADKRVKRYLTEAFSKPPFRTDELKILLEKSKFAQNDRVAIIEELRRREAAMIERDATLAKLRSAARIVPAAKRLQYSLNGSSFKDVPFPLYVMQGSSVTFKGSAGRDSWQWSGTSGASCEGVTIKVAFPKISTDLTDFKTVSAARGGNTITAEVIVYDLLPIYTPEDDFPGRDRDAYGVCEFINLSYKTIPAGINESDLGGLQWVISKGGGDLYGAAGGIGTYQCPDVGGTFSLELHVIGRPVVGERVPKN